MNGAADVIGTKRTMIQVVPCMATTLVRVITVATALSKGSLFTGLHTGKNKCGDNLLLKLLV